MQSDISIGKFVIFYHNDTQNVLTYDRHLCCLQSLEKLIWQKNGIKSREFVFDNFLQLLTWINELHTFLAWHISGVARCNLTFPLESLSFFSITILRMFWRTTVICVVYRDLKKLIWQKNGINSWAFSFDHFLQLSMWINNYINFWLIIFLVLPDAIWHFHWKVCHFLA